MNQFEESIIANLLILINECDTAIYKLGWLQSEITDLERIHVIDELIDEDWLTVAKFRLDKYLDKIVSKDAGAGI